MNPTLKRTSAWAAAGLAGISAVQFGSAAFRRLVRTDVQTLLDRSSTGDGATVTAQMLRSLPEPVRRYLTHTGVVGTPFVRTVRLRQTGRMRTGPDQPWLPLKAEEWYTVDPPGFVWAGTMHMGPLAVARARDMYLDGRGHMLVKAVSLVTVVDANGEEMDQGSMMRYLSEMIWFPSAFLADNISFEAVDDFSARVTLTDHGRTASATMSFDGEGRLTNFVAQRYRTVARRCELETWSTPITGYRRLAGLNLPVRGKAVWKLADGEFDYVDVLVDELEHDVTHPDPGTRSPHRQRSSP
jgi:hypothetical protein